MASYTKYTHRMDHPNVISTAQAAKRIGVSKNTLLRWISQGLIPDVKRDWRRWRVWTEEDIQRANAFKQAYHDRPAAAARRHCVQVGVCTVGRRKHGTVRSGVSEGPGGLAMTVRPATAGDAQRCAEISALRPANELEALLDQSDVQWLVIESDEGTVVGIGIIHFWPATGVAWVWDLTIEEKERGRGYGRGLLRGMISAAREMGARVLMDFETTKTTPLSSLYLKTGFRICGTNDRWFAADKDATAAFYGYDL